MPRCARYVAAGARGGGKSRRKGGEKLENVRKTYRMGPPVVMRTWVYKPWNKPYELVRYIYHKATEIRQLSYLGGPILWGKVGLCKENLGKNGGKRLGTLAKCEENVETKMGKGKGWEKLENVRNTWGENILEKHAKYVRDTWGKGWEHMMNFLEQHDEHAGKLAGKLWHYKWWTISGNLGKHREKWLKNQEILGKTWKSHEHLGISWEHPEKILKNSWNHLEKLVKIQRELVGGLEHDFFHILGMSSSQLTFIFFRGVGQPPTSITVEWDVWWDGGITIDVLFPLVGWLIEGFVYPFNSRFLWW